MSEIKNVVLNKRVPIIIPLFNAVEYTMKAVDSIRANTHANLYEIIFVDNASTDGTKEYLKRLVAEDPDHIRVITNDVNLGYGGGMNTGLRALSAFQWEYCCIANNDLIFTPNWLYQMLECLQLAPIENLGAVGPVSNAAGGSQGIQANYQSEAAMGQWSAEYHQLHQREWAEAGRLVGLCVLMTRKFFDTVGYFDERFVGGMWEDNDWCLRARLAGFKFAVDRSTFLHHFMSKTFAISDVKAPERFHSNKKRYYDKWKETDNEFEKLALKNHEARTAGPDGSCPEPTRLESGLIKKFIVAACRVKDGAKYLEKTLPRISEFADEIVILNSALTTDNTEEVCRRFPKVVLIEKDHDDDNGYAEEKSRNHVLDMAYSRHPDWIYCFDADEMPVERVKLKLDKLTNPANPEILFWAFPIVHLWNGENQQRLDGVWGRFYQGRMFRALPGLRIKGGNSLIHCGSTPNFPPENMGISTVKIIHYGNLDANDRAKKYDRYTKIDTDKDLNMVLGMWKDYYWRLYYGDPDQKELATFTGFWKVLADPKDWARPPYGSFFDRDCYRHVADERGALFVPFSEKSSISLCMLIHNEGKMVVDCLESVRHLVDEIICVDTGCSDATPEMAEQMGAEIHKFDWNDNYSDARNFSLSKATGDWILRLDPDEVFPNDHSFKIMTLVRDPNVEGYIFPIRNWLENPQEKGLGAQWALSETCRLFKNQYPKIKYSNLVHEELDDSFIALRKERLQALIDSGVPEAEAKSKEQSLMNIARAPVILWHFGYLRGTEFLDKKFGYYCKLGNKQIAETPNDPRPYFTTAVHYLHVGEMDKAIENYKKVLDMDPNNHMACNDCGVLLYQQGKVDQAEKYFRRALEIITKGNGNIHENHRERVDKNLKMVRNATLSMLLL